MKDLRMKLHHLSRIVVALSLMASSMAQAQTQTAAAPADTSAMPATPPAITVATAPAKVTSLIKIDELIGTGAEATPGSYVEVHYTGWLYDPKSESRRGTQFDSSRTSGTPFTFQLGARQVIRGWDLGVAGMKIGGKRTLIIPGYLGYGSTGASTIPPNATLMFDVELISVK